MEPTATSEPFSAASSFASFLASLTGQETAEPKGGNDDGLADDIAVLSYEQALRTHGRARAAGIGGAMDEADLGEAGDGSGTAKESRAVSPSPEKLLKRASITLRLSEGECAQLRLRAAEAGLTVSAYLRSCALEVESLRSQVKTTLMELRRATASPRVEGAGRTHARQWRRFWPFAGRSKAI